MYNPIRDSNFDRDYDLNDKGQRLRRSQYVENKKAYKEKVVDRLSYMNVNSHGKPRKSYYDNGMGLHITKRYRGSRELINKLQTLNDICWDRLCDSVMEWAEELKRELKDKYPLPYKGDFAPRLNNGHSKEYWYSDFSIGGTGIQANIWNEQLSDNGFDYVSDINDYGQNWRGVPYQTPKGFVDMVLNKKTVKFHAEELVDWIQHDIDVLGL